MTVEIIPTVEEIKAYLNQPFAFIEKRELIRRCWFLLTSLTEMEERVKELLENRSNILVEMNKQIVERDIALEQAEFRLKRLQEAVDRHRIDVWGDDLVGHHADEELYKTRKEII